MLNKHATGVIMIISGAICYGLPGIIVSLALKHGAHTNNIIATQYLLSFILFFLLSEFTRNKSGIITTREKIIALFTGIPLLGVTYCFFHAVFYIGVPTATLLMMQSSWIAPLVNSLVKKAPIAGKDIVVLLCIITGVAIATGAFSEAPRLNLMGISWGLGAAVCYSLVILSSSHIAKESRVLDKARLLTLGAFITAVCVMKDNINISPFTTDSDWSLLTAIFSSVLPVLLFGLGMPRTAPSLAGMLVTIELPAACIFSYFLLSEKINADQFIGSLVIILSLIIPGLISRFKAEKSG